ncbi:MAG: hypothetical protein LBF38_08685, partial [Deltaproteobacteria bacterium]|nr:hypothetical protein [Deltaproteobacteria bacterium]
IIFPPNKLKDSSESLVIGTLISPHDYKSLNIKIIKAVANIGGTFYDLTNNVRLIEPLKLEMAMPSEQTKTCPNKILDYNVVEGIFKGLDCVDFCMIAIEVNGNSEFFHFYERNIGYFFEDEKNIGKKIKFVVETRQAFMYETEIEFGECVEITKITNFAVLSK